jgi:solute carrier family 38 (sodium-coupled neutral amino acid transporter), member 11
VTFQFLFTKPDDSPQKVQLILDTIPRHIHVLATLIIILSAMTLALITCDLGIVLEITVRSKTITLTNQGGLSATMIAFILPPACYLKLQHGDVFKRKNSGPLLCILFGVVVSFTSTSLIIFKTLRGSEKKLC